MREKIRFFLSNESKFGKAMQRAWILIAANIMFVIFSFPVITAGPAFCAMYYVCLKTLRSKYDDLNPIVDFWTGFRSCFKKAILYWLIVLVIAVIAFLDIRFTMYMGGIMTIFRYAIYLICAVVLLITFFMFPVMAAFEDTLPGLIRNSLFFASKNPLRALLVVFINVFPMVLTYMDLQRLPLYSFLWVTFAFAGIAMIVSNMLVKDFNKYLPEAYY